MKTTLLLSSVLLAVSGVFATPITTPAGSAGPADPKAEVNVKQRAPDAAAPTVTQILQFALTLENLESAFYQTGLARFDNNAFVNAGMPTWERGRIAQIAQHEANHVKFLNNALGSSAPAPCEYSFPINDVESFVQMAIILENVGDAAYIGAAQYLGSNPSALTAAGSILSMEARHAAWLNAITQSMSPWSTAFDVPLDGNEAYSLASPFIKSCPSSNPTLPFTAFPKLTVNGKYTPGSQISLSFDNSKVNGQSLFLALQTGLNTIFTPITNNKATLPQGLQGFVYATVSTNGQQLLDGSVIAGPAILNFPFLSSASNPN